MTAIGHKADAQSPLGLVPSEVKADFSAIRDDLVKI
jgi:hypothetical protein